ncbi:MAG: LapA family protein [Syntrophotaleaceae bacterium]
MQKLKWVPIAVAAGLLVIIIFQNTEPIETRVLFASFTMPMAVLLFVVAVLGFLCGVVLTLVAAKKS